MCYYFILVRSLTACLVGRQGKSYVLTLCQNEVCIPLRKCLQERSRRMSTADNAKIVLVKHIIDCDALPYIPNGWEVRPEDQLLNTVKGQLEWDLTKIALYLSESQKNGKVIKGEKLRKELGNQPILNANVLDYLFAHPDLIPEEWKDKAVFFWGTTYRGSDGGLCVRCLTWHGSRWLWHCRWLDSDWGEAFPAVVRASSA